MLQSPKEISPPEEISRFSQNFRLFFLFLPLFCVVSSTSASGGRIWQAGFTVPASGWLAGLSEQHKAFPFAGEVSSPSSLLPPFKKKEN